MSGTVYSFVFDRSEALKVYPQIGKSDLVLGILASIPPQVDWEGCIVYEGMSPMDEPRTACVAVQGNGAAEIQQKLVESFERKGIPIIQVYEGGPEVRQMYAKAVGQAWVQAFP